MSIVSYLNLNFESLMVLGFSWCTTKSFTRSKLPALKLCRGFLRWEFHIHHHILASRNVRGEWSSCQIALRHTRWLPRFGDVFLFQPILPSIGRLRYLFRFCESMCFCRAFPFVHIRKKESRAHSYKYTYTYIHIYIYIYTSRECIFNNNSMLYYLYIDVNLCEDMSSIHRCKSAVFR